MSLQIFSQPVVIPCNDCNLPIAAFLHAEKYFFVERQKSKPAAHQQESFFRGVRTRNLRFLLTALAKSRQNRNTADSDTFGRNSLKEQGFLRGTRADKITVASICVPFLVEWNICNIGIKRKLTSANLFIRGEILRADRQYGDNKISLCFREQTVNFAAGGFFKRGRAGSLNGFVKHIVKFCAVRDHQVKSAVDAV